MYCSVQWLACDRAPCNDGYLFYVADELCYSCFYLFTFTKSDTEMFNGCCIPVSAVQNKHMFVYNPDSGRTVVINASLVDVSPVISVSLGDQWYQLIRSCFLIHILQNCSL